MYSSAPRRRPRSAIWRGALIGCASLAVWTASAYPQTLGGLTSNGERLFAVRGARVLTFDREGRLRGACGDFAIRPARSETRPRVSALEGADVLRLAGLPDDDDQTPEAEEVLAEEGLLGGRRRPSPPSLAIEPRALAAIPGTDEAWIATSGGLFRGKDGICRQVGLEGRDLLLVAAGAGAVVAAGEGMLWRLGTDASVVEVAAGLAATPRALAIGPDGRTYVGDDEGVLEIRQGRVAVRILDTPTEALAICDEIAVALTGHGVYRWAAGGSPTRVADRPPVRTIACGNTGEERFIATGVGVWTSPDGQTWTARPEWLGRSVNGAASAGRVVWLAVDDRLFPLGSPGRAAATFNPELSTISGPHFRPLPVSRLRASWFPWPRITVLFAAQQTASRAGWSIEVALAFPLGRGATQRTDATRLAAELVARDARLAREEPALARVGSRGAHPDGDEREAVARFVRREREALR